MRGVGAPVGGRQYRPGLLQRAERSGVGEGVQVAAQKDGFGRLGVAFAHHAVDDGGLIALRCGRRMVEVGGGDHVPRQFDDRQHARLRTFSPRQGDGEMVEDALAGHAADAVASAPIGHGSAEAVVPAAHGPGDAFELENAARAGRATVEFVEADGVGADLPHHFGHERVVVGDVLVEGACVVGHQPYRLRRSGIAAAGQKKRKAEQRRKHSEFIHGSQGRVSYKVTHFFSPDSLRTALFCRSAVAAGFVCGGKAVPVGRRKKTSENLEDRRGVSIFVFPIIIKWVLAG